MRSPGPHRRIAVAAAVAGALAAAAAGCGREGDLVGGQTATAPQATAALTEPATGTTPLTTTSPKRDGSGTRTTATTPRQESPGTASTPTATTPRAPAAVPTDDTQLRRTAAEHARDRFSLPVTSKDVTLVHSRRKPRWAIASGTYGRTPWVVWLRDGKVALGTTDAKRFNPIAVPCDVRPAFSEPSC
ncbi:MAG: hypothetical protein Q8K79_01135 [Solirubrobacteraceae bacterium]|nr:hypothetical protein [Solirubrobacteraceae bacterium]